MVAHLLLPYQKSGAAPLQPRDLLQRPAGDPEEELEAALAKQRELRERGELED